jgi:hypothetical protein
LPDYVIELPTLVRVLPEVVVSPCLLSEELRQSNASWRSDFVQDEIIAHRRRIRDGAAVVIDTSIR